jgi:hypothetical protein
LVLAADKGSGRVVLIDLHGSGLEDTVLLSLGNFSLWSIFNLSDNNFAGRVLRKLGQRKAIGPLDLSGNLLRDSIPVELGLVDKLEYLYLEANHLENNIFYLWKTELAFIENKIRIRMTLKRS